MAVQVTGRRVAVAVVSSGLLLAGTATSASATNSVSAHHPRSWFTNCTQLRRHWPHGVGKKHAHDHTTGTPVTNFKHDTKLYKHAIKINSGLDADKDGIACEEA